MKSWLHREPLLVWTGGVLILAVLSATKLSQLLAPDYLRSFTPGLNLIAFILALAQIPAIASHHFQGATGIPSLWPIDGAPPRQMAPDAENRPDIYYIIPDAYPSDAWQREAMNYDNSEFSRALQERGFIINEHAQSNYGYTLLSVASTLNMRYIDANPSQFSDKDYLHMLIADNEVARTLQRLGYTYVQLLNGFFVPSPTADYIRDFTPEGAVDVLILPATPFEAASESAGRRRPIGDISYYYKRSFLTLYVDTTLCKVFADELRALLASDTKATYDFVAPERFLDTLDELDSIAAMPEATFTVVHLIKPHIPTTFDEQGNIISPINRPKPHEYLAELRFINKKFLEAIDSILQGSEHDPIIIFQSDHGSTYGVSTGDSAQDSL